MNGRGCALTFLATTGATMALSSLPIFRAYAQDLKEADSLKGAVGKGDLPPWRSAFPPIR